MLRCSASDAVSTGPSRRARRSGQAIGDRPGDPGGNRTSLPIRSMPAATLRNLCTRRSTSDAPRRHPVVGGQRPVVSGQRSCVPDEHNTATLGPQRTAPIVGDPGGDPTTDRCPPTTDHCDAD